MSIKRDRSLNHNSVAPSYSKDDPMKRRTFLNLMSASLLLAPRAVGWSTLSKGKIPFECDELGLKLTPKTLTDSIGTITLDQLPDPVPQSKIRLTDVTPLTERLWRIALSAIESNIVQTTDGQYFGAGTDYGVVIFTRDISYAGILGLASLYPQQLLDSLKVSRTVRSRIGFTVSGEGYFVPEINVPWKSAGMEDRVFARTYHTPSYTRQTDDVVWLWCANELLTKRSGGADWQWMYDTGIKYFNEFYAPFFDPHDGLYRGQASFVDIHSPTSKATGYPEDFSVQDCVLLKALSTNCLYVKGLEAMASASARLGLKSESSRWKKQAKALRVAIRKEFRNKDGTFAYYKDRHGNLEQRREALGTALAVITGVVSGRDARTALDGYPVSSAGVPLFLPFFPTPRWYHNNSSWPFVDTFFLRAWEQAYHVDRTGLNAALLARTCRGGAFHEVVDYRTSAIKGSVNQLWSAAGFIDVCHRAGLLTKAIT